MGHGVCRDCWKFLGEIPFAGSSPVFLRLVFFQVWILSQFYPYFYFHFISILSVFYPHFMSTLSLFFLYFFSIFSYCFSVLSLFYPHFIPISLISLFYLYTAKKMGKGWEMTSGTLPNGKLTVLVEIQPKKLENDIFWNQKNAKNSQKPIKMGFQLLEGEFYLGF